MRKTIIYLILVLLLTNIVYANPIISIGTKALNFLPGAGPQITQGIEYVMCAYTIATCIQGKITGEITGKFSQTAMNALPKDAVKAISTYNQVRGYVDQGASIAKDLQVNKNGQIESGQINFQNNKETNNVGKIINPNLKAEDIKVKGIILNKKEDGSTTFTFQSGKVGEVTIKGREFKNIEKGNIVLDKNGEISSAAFYTDKKGGIYNLGNIEFNAPPSSIVEYSPKSKTAKEGLIIVQISGKQKLSTLPKLTKGSKTGITFSLGDQNANLDLTENIKLTNGDLFFRDEKFYTHSATINKVRIKSEKEILLDFEGKTLDEKQNYVSFDVPNKKIIINAPDKINSIEFQPGNEFIRVDKRFNDVVKIENTAHARLELTNRQKDDLIDSLDVISYTEDSSTSIISGKINILKNGNAVRSKIIKNYGKEREPNSAAMSVKFLDPAGNNIFGDDPKSALKYIVSSDNEISLTEELKDYGPSNIGNRPPLSERFSMNYQYCQGCGQATTGLNIEIRGGDGKELTYLSELLNNREKRALLKSLKYDMTMQEKDAVHKIVIYNDANWRDLGKEDDRYKGADAFSEDHEIHISKSQISNRGVLTHEAAHARLYDLNKEDQKDVKEYLTELQNQVQPYSTNIKIEGTHGNKRWADNGFSGPASGCTTAYGCDNVLEDISEFSRVANTRPEVMKRLITKESDYYETVQEKDKESWAKLYRKKLSFLYSKGFIKPEMYKKITEEIPVVTQL